MRIDETSPLSNPGANKPLTIPVKNWFDHTDFRELTVHWSVNNESGKARGPAIRPHNNGAITIPARNWKSTDVVRLEFYDAYQRLVDEFKLLMKPMPLSISLPQGATPAFKQDSTNLIVSGKDFEILFDRATGMISSGKYRNKEVIKGGPYFHLTGGKLGNWKLNKLSVLPADDHAVEVTINGNYDSVGVVYDLRIDGTGLITTEYTLNNFRVSAPMPRKNPWNDQDAGGFEEVGVSYLLTSDVDKLNWKRKGIWSVYPGDHIGRNEGTADRRGINNEKVFGQKPQGKWYQDEKDFSVFGQYDIGGRGTNDFKSTKENIYHASAIASTKDVGVTVESNAENAVRLQVLPDRSSWVDNNSPQIRYSGSWKATKDTLDYFSGSEIRSAQPGDFAEFTFAGTGIAWMGSKGRIFGLADVYIDGKLEVPNITFFDRGGAQSRAVIYSKDGLPRGNHTIKIVAKEGPVFRGRQGNQNNDNAVGSASIPLDAFIVLDGNMGGDVMLIINNRWNHSKMGLGNYMKDPILIGSDYRNRVTFRLTDGTQDERPLPRRMTSVN